MSSTMHKRLHEHRTRVHDAIAGIHRHHSHIAANHALAVAANLAAMEAKARESAAAGVPQQPAPPEG